MATAHEILTGLMASFRERMPGVEFRETFGVGEVLRSPARACVAGTVAKENTQGDAWSAKLAFQIFLPRNTVPGGAEQVLVDMADCARETQPLLKSMERGPAAVDKTTGWVAVGCAFHFAKPGSEGESSGSKKTAYPVELDGNPYTVTGWKAANSVSGSGLTAIGESVPFYYKSSREFTVELQGLDMEHPELLDGFTLRLGDQNRLYTGCRWKSISAGGNAVLSAVDCVEEG